MHHLPRHKRLQYLESKHKLLAFLGNSEVKLKTWMSKYGFISSVEMLLNDYTKFIVDQQVFAQFDDIFAKLKVKADTLHAALARGKERETERETERDSQTDRE